MIIKIADKLSKIVLISLISLPAVANFTVIAHRGAPGYLPEHSLPGLAMAHGWNVDYIEPDVVITKDNHAVILHDYHIDTTTDIAKKFPNRKRKDGRYYAIDFTLKEIKTLTLHERVDLKTMKNIFPARYPQGSTIFEVPTLKEYISLLKGLNFSTKKNIGMYLEIKNPEFHLKNHKDITKITMNTLKSSGALEKSFKLIIQCFYPNTLKRLKSEFRVKFPLIQLIAKNSWHESSIDYERLLTKKGIQAIATYADGIGPSIDDLYTLKNGKPVPNKVMTYTKENNLLVHPFTHRSDYLPKGFFKRD